MSIIETGNDSLTPEIVLCGLRSGRLSDGLVRSDRGDPVALDRQSFYPKLLGVRCKDFAVVEDYVRHLRTGEGGCTEHGQNPTQSGFHKNIRSSPPRCAAISEITLYSPTQPVRAGCSRFNHKFDAHGVPGWRRSRNPNVQLDEARDKPGRAAHVQTFRLLARDPH